MDDRTLKKILRLYQAPPPSPALWSRLESAIAAGVETEEIADLDLWSWPRAAAAIAATILLTVAIAYFPGQIDRGGTDSSVDLALLGVGGPL